MLLHGFPGLGERTASFDPREGKLRAGTELEFGDRVLDVACPLPGKGVSGVEGGFMIRPPHRLQTVAPGGLWLMPELEAPRELPSRPYRRGW